MRLATSSPAPTCALGRHLQLSCEGDESDSSARPAEQSGLEEGAVKKRTRGWVAGAAVLAAAMAGLQLIRRRRRNANEEGRFERESEIDDRIAESFPASDPPWQP
jgi:hypothetical protein